MAGSTNRVPNVPCSEHAGYIRPLLQKPDGSRQALRPYFGGGILGGGYWLSSHESSPWGTLSSNQPSEKGRSRSGAPLRSGVASRSSSGILLVSL